MKTEFELRRTKARWNINIAIELLAQILAVEDDPKKIKELLHGFLDGVKLNYGIEH